VPLGEVCVAVEAAEQREECPLGTSSLPRCCQYDCLRKSALVYFGGAGIGPTSSPAYSGQVRHEAGQRQGCDEWLR